MTLRLMLLPWIPPPHPVVPDEYSHLLLAKTFLAGRLTNPPHPLWQHFESIHILSQPTYNSMYMAGQACFLALGKLLTGGFFGGVIISTALFCAALTWFLRMFVPPGWALFGGMIAAVRFGAASYWNNSYWGGSVAALGGALALGGWAGLMKNWKIGPALAFASGAVLLANTRPYEGFGFMAVLFISLVWRAFKQRARMRWSRVALSVAAASIVFSAAGWAMARHWRAVTGSALTLPYQVNQRTYGWPLTLPFTPVRQIAYRHPELARYRDFEIGEHEMITNPDKIPLGLLQKTASLWIFFFGPALSGALLFATQILSTPRLRVIWAAAGVVGLQALTEQSAGRAGDYAFHRARFPAPCPMPAAADSVGSRNGEARSAAYVVGDRDPSRRAVSSMVTAGRDNLYFLVLHRCAASRPRAADPKTPGAAGQTPGAGQLRSQALRHGRMGLQRARYRPFENRVCTGHGPERKPGAAEVLLRSSPVARAHRRQGVRAERRRRALDGIDQSVLRGCSSDFALIFLSASESRSGRTARFDGSLPRRGSVRFSRITDHARWNASHDRKIRDIMRNDSPSSDHGSVTNDDPAQDRAVAAE